MSDEATTIHIDGAARGNPGPAAFAFVIVRPGQPVIEEYGRLGRATNNVAEYTALVRALERAAELNAGRLLIHSDSELLVKQMTGAYRVKSDDLRGLYEQAQELARRFPDVALRHVPRAANQRADALCNQALDGDRPAAKAAPARAAAPASDDLQARVRADALFCLRSAAEAWAAGNPAQPDPALVWEQLWSVLEEGGVLRKTKR